MKSISFLEKVEAKKLHLNIITQLLGQIPLVIEVGEVAEYGKSIFSQNNKEVVSVFENIARKLIG